MMKLIIKIMKSTIKTMKLIIKIIKLIIKTMRLIMKTIKLIMKIMKLIIKTIKCKLIKKNQHNFNYLEKCLKLFFDNKQFFIEFYFSILIIYEILKPDF